MIGGRRLLGLALVASVAVGCAGEQLPDDETVRAEVVPRIEATFEEIGLVPELRESETLCPARFGLGGTPTIAVVGSAPAEQQELDRVAEVWGVAPSDDVRMSVERYVYRARVIGDGVLQVQGWPVCPSDGEY